MTTHEKLRERKIKEITQELFIKYTTSLFSNKNRYFSQERKRIFQNHLAKSLREELNSNNITVFCNDRFGTHGVVELEIYNFNNLIFEGRISIENEL